MMSNDVRSYDVACFPPEANNAQQSGEKQHAVWSRRVNTSGEGELSAAGRISLGFVFFSSRRRFPSSPALICD